MSKLVYEGSVKNLWEITADKLEFEYTDAYSVFDWGRMPDTLAHKGDALAAIGAYFFKAVANPDSWKTAQLRKSPWLAGFKGRLRELLEAEISVLEREGLHHHLLERTGTNKLRVQRVSAIGPVEHQLGPQALYHYSGQGWEKRVRLIPLEVVFRFGVPQGSSLIERLTPAYVAQLGLESLPLEGKKLDRPVIEFFSKLEGTDRFFTWEQALNYSGLTYANFEKLLARSMVLAVWLAGTFEGKGLELWDGKFEWALDDDQLMLVDSIGPDELRLLDPMTGTQISKEFLRLFYRKTEWFEAVKLAKSEAATDSEIDWKARVRKRTGEPPMLSKEFREAATALYPSLALAICGENPGVLGLPLPRMLERIRKCHGK
ncbi:MAG: hypothetical protein HY074_02615 [Deltaproteobacteria bacterium]|nr:hypothetical protein [Deltaproteobacteria bacterium]